MHSDPPHGFDVVTVGNNLDAAAAQLYQSLDRLYTKGGPPVVPLSSHAAASLLPSRVPDGVGAVISTSGSTGAPKQVALPRQGLLDSSLATVRELGPLGAWLLCLPPAYVAGLQVVSRAVVSGTPVTAVRPGAFTPQLFLEAVSRMAPGPKFTALVPTQIRRLLSDPASVHALGEFDGILIGGEPLDEETRQALSGSVRFISTYGMTETYGGCVYDGEPLRTVNIRLEHDEIHIGSQSMTFYLAASAQDAARYYRGSGQDGRPEMTWFTTSDRGCWDAASKLVVLGRTDDVINTGGVKISAQAVERAIRDAFASVAEVVVLGEKDRDWGNIVTAFVVLKDPCGEKIEYELISRELTRSMSRAAVPKKIVYSAVLPTLENGKADRLAIQKTILEH